jgi:hypothetical protein
MLALLSQFDRTPRTENQAMNIDWDEAGLPNCSLLIRSVSYRRVSEISAILQFKGDDFSQTGVKVCH